MRYAGLMPLLFVLALLSSCGSIVHGYTASIYRGIWWKVDRTDDHRPSGNYRLLLKMEQDPTIRGFVNATGMPDYLFVGTGSDESLELAYLEKDEIYLSRRTALYAKSQMVSTTPIGDHKWFLAMVDVGASGYQPMQPNRGVEVRGSMRWTPPMGFTMRC